MEDSKGYAYTDDLRAKLRRKRVEIKMSQAILAERMGVDQQFLSEVERGKKAPGRFCVKKMMEVLYAEN